MYGKITLLFLFAFALVLSGCNAPAATTFAAQPVPGGKHIIGYYPSWSAGRGSFVKDIPAAKITHINYAFSNVSSGGECILGDPAADVERVYSAEESVNGKADSDKNPFNGNFNQLLQLKQKYPHLQIFISLGGWTWSSNFSNAAKDDASRKAFVKSCADLYLVKYKGVFDGIDVDWEYPVNGGLEPGKAEDRENFTALLAEFRAQLDELGKTDGKHYLLTIAAPIGPATMKNMELDKIAQTLDWINIMAYDFHGTWDNVTNFNAPLFSTPNDPGDSSLNVNAAVDNYLKSGVPANKLVLGVPFYGRGWANVGADDDGLYQPASGAANGTWEAGSFDYNDLAAHYLPAYTRRWNDNAKVPWLYNSETKIFVSYDDAESLSAKAGYVKDQGLAGVMIWELSAGDESLIDALHTGLQAGGPPMPTPTAKVMSPRPFEAELHRVSGIKIDGKLDDWSAEPTFVLDDESRVVYKLNPKSWNGPQDFSAQVWAGWSEEGLYFAVKVTDDIHVQTNADTDLWHGDHVELQFDTDLERDYNEPGMNNDDYQIGISVGDFDKVPPAAFAWSNGAGVASPLTDIQQAQVKTDDGYIVEIFVPKSVLEGIQLEEGASFGMNVSPSDTDNVSEGQKVMLSTSPTRTYADPRTFGKITLVK
ncbi:MAG: hypothetical protein LC099_02330 [Anaerolineales bacterium]|nr:hypothetical protein [Anaerolineales bacterium]